MTGSSPTIIHSPLRTRLYWRELGTRSGKSDFKALYGDEYWAKSLDIVNELGGHRGCVNALRYVSETVEFIVYSRRTAAGPSPAVSLPQAPMIKTS